MYTIDAGELSLIAINGYGAMQKPLEFAAFLEMVAKHRPEVILEIGLGKAGSSWALSKLDGVDLMIGIDLPGGPWGGGPEVGQMQFVADHTPATRHYIAGNSHNGEALQAVKKSLGERQVDLLFIDGDHSYGGVKTDYLLFSPFVRPGGLIAFHDICEHDPSTGCEVKRWWDEMKNGGLPPEDYVEFISEPVNWGGIGVVIKR